MDTPTTKGTKDAKVFHDFRFPWRSPHSLRFRYSRTQRAAWHEICYASYCKNKGSSIQFSIKIWCGVGDGALPNG